MCSLRSGILNCSPSGGALTLNSQFSTLGFLLMPIMIYGMDTKKLLLKIGGNYNEKLQYTDGSS